MKITRLLAPILGILVFSGCSTHKSISFSPDPSYGRFPPLSSSVYPSFKPVSEIVDEIKVKLPDASGKTKVFVNVTYTDREQSVLVRAFTNWEWDIAIAKNLVYGNHVWEGTYDILNKSISLNTRADCVHDLTGKEIRFDFSYETDMKLEFTDDELATFKKKWSFYFTDLFRSLGKTLKAGDVMKYFVPEFTTTKRGINPDFPVKIPQIVRGMGVYKNKRVLVVDFALEDRFQDSEYVFEVRGKGYDLYDAETFIQLFGQNIFYTSVSSPQKEGVVYAKSDMTYEAYDVKVRSIIDSPNPLEGGTIKESAKSSWSEASDKIKALGELLQKGLISKEEYESKKSELLKNF